MSVLLDSAAPPATATATATAAAAGPAAASLAGAPARTLYAALDLGTNNCRLLIVEPDARAHANGGFRVVDSFSRIVRLGEGLAATGRLGEAAMARTLDALAVCAGKIAQRGAGPVRAVATEACRRAANGEAFLRRVREQTGLALEIVTPREEALLALCGVTPLVRPQPDVVLVVDIGGGSTEFSCLDLAALDGGGLQEGTPLPEAGLAAEASVPGLIGWRSLPLGVVTLAESAGSDSAADYAAMVARVREGLAGFAAELDLAGRAARLGQPLAVQCIGTSGTVTTLAAFGLGLPRYQRDRVDGLDLEATQLRTMARGLRALAPAARAAHPCIGRDRADLIVPGCAILEAVLDSWPIARVRVADRGLREGILMLLMAEERTRAAAAGGAG